MKIEKGMLISVDSWWYVVVNVKINLAKQITFFECICDNANNTYIWEIDQIHSFLQLSELSRCNREVDEAVRSRPIPFEVVTEVLAGLHDERFA